MVQQTFTMLNLLPIGDGTGHLVRCSDYSKKCSECSYCKYRQLRVINYSEPEELAGGISEIDDTEKEMDLENIPVPTDEELSIARQTVEVLAN